MHSKVLKERTKIVIVHMDLLEIVGMIIEMIIEEILTTAVIEDDMMIMEEIPKEPHMIVVLPV